MSFGTELNDDVTKLMAEKALEIFRLCDTEQKGLLTKSDMRRLSDELPLSAQQLEQVFDSLDVAHNGFLTATEFTKGFGQFLGLSQPQTASRENSRLPSVVYEDDSWTDGVESTEDEQMSHQFNEMLTELGANELLENVDVIKSIWLRLNHQPDHELLENFEDFLRRMTSELQRTNLDYEALQTKFNNNSSTHNEEIQKLCEEMELQIASEKQRIKNEERLKEQRLKEQMAVELEETDRRLQELLVKQQELEAKLSEMNAKQTKTQQENERLVRERDEMEERLGNTSLNLSESQSVIADLRHQKDTDSDVRSLAAVQISQWIELEREKVSRKLHLLRETSRDWHDFQDEKAMTRNHTSQRKQLESTDEHSSDQEHPSSNSAVSEDIVDYGHRQQPIGANSTTDKLTTEHQLLHTAKVADRLFKIVFVGDSGVGKSTFIHRFCSQTFISAFSTTIGVDFQVKSINVDGQMVALQLWDTAGQERFRSFTKHYFRKADGVIVMYDVTCSYSFNSVREWMTSIQENIEEGAVIVLLGNKTDLVDEQQIQRVVDAERGSKLAKEFDALFYETSAKTGQNIDTCIVDMTRLLRKHEDDQLQHACQLTTKLDANPNFKKKFSCC